MDPPGYEGKGPIYNLEDDNGWIFLNGVLNMYYLMLGDFGAFNLTRSY